MVIDPKNVNDQEWFVDSKVTEIIKNPPKSKEYLKIVLKCVICDKETEIYPFCVRCKRILREVVGDL